MVAAPDATGRTVYELSTERYPAGELSVVSLRGVEQLSRPFSFEILLFGASIDAASLERDLLGQRATLWMRGSDEEERAVHGVVRRLEAEGISGGGEHRHRFRVWLAPRLWLLGRGRNSRIFQDKTVPEIVATVLGASRVDHVFRLARTYAPRRYCVQHQESDLAFVRRLLAEEGIFYAFEHPPEGDREVVVFCDDAHLCAPIAGAPALVFRDGGGMKELDEDVRRFRVSRRVEPGATRLREFDFLRPSLDLHAVAEAPAPDGAFDPSRLHVYDHHGEFEGVAVDAATAARHLEQHRARAWVGQGESRCRRLLPGQVFTLTGDALAALDGRYTVIGIEHEGRTPEAARAGGEAPEVYKNRFLCVPADVTPRPRRPKRRLQQVMETAIVVGPAGQEIHTDEHGRVKVQFHWDREGARNEHSSCWIRTMQAWAGTGWGFQFIPRVGMEVMVMFLAGDADRPMVIGATYNAEHPPPFPLPSSKTRSGIRTQTSRGGGGYNELSFEDRAGHERVHLHAQKDHEVVVKHDQTTRVGNHRTEQVSGHRFTVVTGNNLMSVGGNLTQSITGDEARAVEGSRSWAVQGNAADVVHGRADVRVAEDLQTRIGGRERREVQGTTDVLLEDDLTLRVHGCSTTLVGQHDQRRSYVLHVEGVTELSGTGATEITSEKGLVLRCGKSSIHLTPERIEVTSPTIVLQGSGGSVALGDDQVKVKARSKILGLSDDKILFKASGASVRLDADARIDGSQVKLKSPDSASDAASDRHLEPTKIELVDDHGDPIPHQRYLVVLGNGEERSGLLDEHGKAEIELDESAQITFPGLSSVETA
jgi:type VI secretion system secreted protein VgrG